MRSSSKKGRICRVILAVAPLNSSKKSDIFNVLKDNTYILLNNNCPNSKEFELDLSHFLSKVEISFGEELHAVSR